MTRPGEDGSLAKVVISGCDVYQGFADGHSTSTNGDAGHREGIGLRVREDDVRSRVPLMILSDLFVCFYHSDGARGGNSGLSEVLALPGRRALGCKRNHEVFFLRR